MTQGYDEALEPPGAADEDDAPTRWGVLSRNPRRLIIALVLIAAAIGVAVFATATFTTSSANAGNLVAAGTLTVDSGKTAVLVVKNVVPGDSANGTVSVTNTGSASGAFSLTTTNLVDTPATPPFSAVLNLTIKDTTSGQTATTIYTGKLNAVSTIQLGRWAAGTTHSYTFTVTFPDQGAAIDNKYQGAQSQLDIVWNAVS